VRGLALAFVIAFVIAFGSAPAAATPTAPAGPHPRILLDGTLRAAWREQAKLPHGPVHGAIALCDEARLTHEHAGAVYQGSEWAKVVQACLVAWAATDDVAHADTAIAYSNALLDDLDAVGDARGGDAAASRDDGYAMRNLGPYTALTYDWLHDRMTADQRAHARARWQAWLARYRAKGYRAHDGGTNYHAGYAVAATLIAIAEAGEAAQEGVARWQDVADTIWGKELAAALADGGVLDGGDWPEGWQYGPLSVAEIALGARAMRGVGVEVPGIARWLAAMLRHHVYALSPGDGMYAGGDTEAETPNVSPNVLELDAIAVGDASPDDKRWARGELVRLQLVDNNYLLFDALAAIGEKPALPPRAKWPTLYVAAGTGTVFARTRWDDAAVWLVTTCHGAIDVDHHHADAGNFVVSRGHDDAIVDPSPYGTLSTLTSNAPTVASRQLPKPYIPSQAPWGKATGFDFVTQRASGVVAVRCDYSDQYRFQERASDVPDALRDLILVPSTDGRDAVVVVVDRANTVDDDRDMFLRFRSPGHFALNGDVATATVGASKVVVASLARSSGKPEIGTPGEKDCFAQGTVRGTCDAARFPVTDLRVRVAGSRPSAAHAITVIDRGGSMPALSPISGDGWHGVRVAGLRDAVIVWRDLGARGDSFTYRVAAAAKISHVILDAPDRDGMATVSARRDGDACAVTISAGGAIPARPLIVTLDDHCAATNDLPTDAVPSAGQNRRNSHGTPHSPRAGCCGAQAAPGSPLATAVVVLALSLALRKRAART
jgi:hypothetical protein